MKRNYAIRLVAERFSYLAPEAIASRLAYGSFVSLEHKFLYVETPKVACSSVKAFLRQLYGAPPVKVEIGAFRETRLDMFVHVRGNVPLPSLVDLDDGTQKRVLTAPEFLRFAIVRNPYRRLISAWRNKALICEPGYERVHENARTFAQFLDFLEDSDLSTCNPHWRRQTDLLFSGAIPYTHIGHIEELSTTEELLGQHIGKRVKFTNDNSGLNIGEPSLNEGIARRIQVLYASGFSTFGYSPDSWRDIKERPLSQEQVLDEIIERNRMISLLYDQCVELKWRGDHPVRTALKRLIDASLSRSSRPSAASNSPSSSPA
jgi:hypothetical protein